DQRLHLRLVDVSWRGAHALPRILRGVAFPFDLLERDRLAVSRQIQAIQVEGAEFEDVLPSILVDVLLDLVSERSIDGDDAIARAFLVPGNQKDALVSVSPSEQVAAGGRLVANDQPAIAFVPGRLERDLDARHGKPVLLEVGRILVDDTDDFELREVARDRGR